MKWRLLQMGRDKVYVLLIPISQITYRSIHSPIYFSTSSYLNNFDIQKTQFVWYQKFMKNVLNTNSHSFLKYICSKLLRILWKQHPIPIYIETSQFAQYFFCECKKGIFDSEFEYILDSFISYDFLWMADWIKEIIKKCICKEIISIQRFAFLCESKTASHRYKFDHLKRV